MKKGTQAMLDAAKDDATLLPFDTVFVTRFVEGSSQYNMPSGIQVFRVQEFNDDSYSVAFSSNGHNDYWYCDSKDLLPAKKSKPKKWQNGTKAQLDAAKDDARLIPKKTYFRHKEGYWWTRADCEENDATQVLMVAWGAEIPPKMACADDLVPA